MRTDCIRDNRATRLPNSSRIGFSLGTAKRGAWIRTASTPVDPGRIGRVVGRVHADGKTYLETVLLLGAGDIPAVRWIDPADVIECYASPPRRIFEFMCGDWRDSSAVLARIERGFLNDSYLDEKESAP